MGCAGSNPLPAVGDTMAATTNGRATAIDGDVADKSHSIVEKVIGNVNMDDVVKKIQDVTGSMENLMGETQEKLSSFFGNVEENAEDVGKTIEDKVNDTTLSDESKTQKHHVILLTSEVTRIIPIDLVESAIGNLVIDEEENNKDRSEINIKNVGINENAKEHEIPAEVEDKKIEEKVEENVKENVEESVEEKVEESVEENVKENVEENIKENVEENVKENVEENVKENVEEKVEEKFEEVEEGKEEKI